MPRLGSLLGDLLFCLVNLPLDLLLRHLDVVLLGVGLRHVEGYELRHDLRLSPFELGRARLHLRG